MPSRNLSIIRRGINRLNDLCQRQGDSNPALKAIQAVVAATCATVNKGWQAFQSAAMTGDKERAERDTAVGALLAWVQRWRPTLLILVPSAESNIRNLPFGAPTPDDIVRVADDMLEVIKKNEKAASISGTAIADLGDKMEAAKKETAEATAALPAEDSARQAFTDACMEANDILVRGTEVVRSIFGRTSPEYRQFIEHGKKDEEAQDEAEAKTGDN